MTRNPTTTVRVVIADDQRMVREGLSVVLGAQAGIVVVGEAANGAEAAATVAALEPDVVLMDIRMPEMDGLAATRRVCADVPTTKVLMLTTYDLDEYVYQALQAGASGFLLKDASAATLADAVRIVAAGDALLAPSVTRRLLGEFARLPRDTQRVPTSPELTPRENEVLVLLARGLSNAEIAAGLFIGEQTVKTHVGRIFDKLALRDRTQAVIYAYENGIVAPGDR